MSAPTLREAVERLAARWESSRTPEELAVRMRCAKELRVTLAAPPPEPEAGGALTDDEFHVLRLLAAGQASAARGREWLESLRQGETVDLPPYEEDEVLVPPTRPWEGG